MNFRQKNFEEALKILLTVKRNSISKKRLVFYFNLLGRCYEKLSKFENAYKSFHNMNLHHRMTKDFKLLCKPEAFLTLQRNLLQDLKVTRKSKVSKHTTNKIPRDPAFIIGFPRSGTTLLDIILRSHSAIDVIEERPIIDSIKVQFKNIGEFDFLGSFPTQSQRQEAIKFYRNEIDQTLNSECQKNNVIIDKLPLNLFELPLIHFLFPSAKYILAIRHPFRFDFKLLETSF